jgi:hypothetical protein
MKHNIPDLFAHSMLALDRAFERRYYLSFLGGKIWKKGAGQVE